jgi:long-chain fatty acid transport protein
MILRTSFIYKFQKVFVPILILSFSFISYDIHAFNGLFPIAYGARQAGMGGAFTGVGGSILDLESNPAHLGRREDASFEMGMGVHNVLLEYDDTKINPNPDYAYTNQIRETPKALFPYIGYASPINSTMGWGIAAYLQGGGGGEFSKIRRITPGGKTINELTGNTVDIPILGNTTQVEENISFRFMNFKVTPGVGFQWGKFGLGLGLDLAFSQMGLRREIKDLTGNIVIPGGFRYQSNPTIGYGGKLGMTWRFSERWLLGYNYTTKNHFHLDGKMRVDSYNPMRNRDIGVSRYMEWPDRHSLGISYQGESWLFSMDLRFIPWSETFSRTYFDLEEAWIETPIGVESNIINFNLQWSNQTVIALGTEYKWSEWLKLRTGYNYGRTPISSKGVNPFLGATTEHNLSAGFTVTDDSRQYHFAAQHGFVGRVSGSNTSDWTIAKSIISPESIQLGQFQHSKATRVYSVYFGIEQKIAK